MKTVMRGAKSWMAAALAVCVTGCANGSSEITSPTPLAIATPSSPSSCAVPGVPSNLEADVDGTSVYLSWSDVSDATDYVVLIGRTVTSADTLLTNSVTAQHTIDDLPSGNHFVRVHAHNWCGTSDPTAAIGFTVR